MSGRWITGLAFISANLGALEILGMAANGSQFGAATVHYYWIGAVPAMIFLGIVMMPFYYGSKVRSVPEYLRRRFNKPTHVLNALSFALATVLIAGVNLFALALVLELLLGWPILVGIVVAAFIVLVYITLGGLTSAIYNEVLQFFVILAALIPLTLVGLHDVGGWEGLKEAVRATEGGEPLLHAWEGTGVGNVTNPLEASWIPIVFGLGFVLSFGYWTTNFAEVQRALSAKTLGAARRTPLIGAYPKIFHPLRDGHPRPRGAGGHPRARLRRAEHGAQQRDPAGDEQVPAQRHDGRRPRGADRGLHGGGRGQRLGVQHGRHLRPVGALRQAGPERRVLHPLRPDRHHRRHPRGHRHGADRLGLQQHHGLHPVAVSRSSTRRCSQPSSSACSGSG